MIKKPAILLGLLLAFSGGAPASQVVEREIECPVCGVAFYATLDLSDYSPDMRLDLRPVGSVTGPWRLPDCPKCGFVIYKLPIPKPELTQCRVLLASEGYKRIKGRSTYFRVGFLAERLGKPPFTVANTYLKASWQEENDAKRAREDQELALKFFSACAQTCGEQEKENSLLLIGELLRRLGRFDAARLHLEGLKGQPGFQKNFFTDIVDYQLKLCGQGDASPHTMEDVRDFRKSFFARLRVRFKKLFGF